MRLSPLAGLLPLVLLVACSSAPPRPMPEEDWAHHAAVYVEKPSKLPWDNAEAKADELKSRVEGDLRAAGLRIVAERQDAGELQVVIGNFDWANGDDSTLTVTLRRDGDELDHLTLLPAKLPCVATFSFPTTLACFAREIAARTLESPAAGVAMQRPVDAAKSVHHTRSSSSSAPDTSAHALSGKLAVLELRNSAPELTHDNARYFTDLVRQAALQAQPQLLVMTRENLLVLLEASGKKLEECEGECEVDTGRRVGADLIVSGELQKLGALFKLSLRLHDTRDGRLLASTIASGKSVEELDQAAQKAALELLGTR